MPRAVRPWFRLYTEAFADPKLRRLRPEHRWIWCATLAAARQSPEPPLLLIAVGVPMTIADLASFAGVSTRQAANALEAMQDIGLIEVDEAGVMLSPRFSDRQFESDNVTQRTRRYRDRERSNEEGRNVPTTFEGTDQRQRQRQIPTPLPPSSPRARPPSARGGAAGNELGATISAAVRLLADAGDWRSTAAALTAFADDGRLDRLRELHARFPMAPPDHLIQLLDAGPLLKRYIAEHEGPAY